MSELSTSEAASLNEQAIKALQINLQRLNQEPRELLSECDEKLNQLVLENNKLKHRLKILRKSIKAVKETKESKPATQISIISHLTEIFEYAVSTAFPKEGDLPVLITLSTNARFGDYQFNSSMAISQTLKKNSVNISPKDVANKIMEHLKKSEVVLKYELSGPGYVNIYLNRNYVSNTIQQILQNGLEAPPSSKKRIIVDFSSPNIAKEMHVGHLRSTIIGDSISRLLEFCGHNVLRLNHIGDWGTQFGMLITHLQEKFPKYLEQEPPIDDLQCFYRESKVKFDEDASFKERAYVAVEKLQKNDPESKKAWNIICRVSRREFQTLYDRLDVRILERGESFYQPYMETVVDELASNGYLEDDNGRKIMWGSKSTIPLTVVKTGGGFTYDTSDMAAIKQRLEEENADWIIYITDAGQATHFSTIFDCSTRTGTLDLKKHRIDHIGFGLVLGEDGKKFKSRSGDTIKLVDLLDEGLKRSMDKLCEKGRDRVLTASEFRAAQESIAYGCVKYADLSHNRNLDYVFSFDKMLEDKGNTAVYLLYALARIKSIARNCGPEYKNKIPALIKQTEFKFEHAKEWNLARTLMKFSDVINEICKDLFIHRLCEYVYEISTVFSEFYSNCYCIEKRKDGTTFINDHRILLSEATAKVLERCLYILGLQPLDKI